MQDTEEWDEVKASRLGFQRRKQAEQSEIIARFRGVQLSWKQRYDRMKQYYSLTDAQIAEITGNSAGSVRTVVNSKTQDFPRWLKLAIYVFETETGLNQGATVHL